jgi:hypothetical protein
MLGGGFLFWSLSPLEVRQSINCVVGSHVVMLIGLENKNKIARGCLCYMLFSGFIVHVLTFYKVMVRIPLFGCLVLVSNVFTMFYSYFCWAVY